MKGTVKGMAKRIDQLRAEKDLLTEWERDALAEAGRCLDMIYANFDTNTNLIKEVACLLKSMEE